MIHDSNAAVVPPLKSGFLSGEVHVVICAIQRVGFIVLPVGV